jgi:antitoxin MazE
MGANDLQKPTETDLSVSRWGNSLAVRLPARLAKDLQAHVGSRLQVSQVQPGSLTLTNPEAVAKLPTREDVLKQARAVRERMPMGYSVVREMRDQGY